MSRVKLTLEGLEKDDEEECQEKTSPTVPQKMANTVEFSLISNDDYKCRHSQPDCGYALQPDRWLEYTIQTMEPDNLELIFDFFEVCFFTPSNSSLPFGAQVNYYEDFTAETEPDVLDLRDLFTQV